MEQEYIIRKARVEEARTIQKVKRDSFEQEMEFYGKDVDSFLSQANLEREIDVLSNNEDKYFSYVVQCGDEIIGGCTIVAEENYRYYVKVIYVSSQVQNKGVGSRLLEFLIAQFPDAKSWHLETPYKSYRNHHFYEKHGFYKAGETEPEEDGFYLFLYERQAHKYDNNDSAHK